MRLLVSLVVKDVRRRIASPAGVIISLAIPLIIAGTMAITFGNIGGGSGQPKVRIVVADLDDTPLSGLISGSSQSAEATEHLDVRLLKDRDAGLEIMKEEDYAALLVIPKGFMEAVLDGKGSELELIKNPAQRFMPVITEQGAQVLALYISTGMRFLKPDDIERLKKLVDGEGWDDAVGLAASITDIYLRIKRAEDLLFPPLIDVKTVEPEEEDEEEDDGVNLFTWMYPGMMVMGLLFVGVTQMKDMLQESTAGTLRRQMAAPLGAGTLLVAKVIAVALAVALSLLILLAMGWLFFDIGWSTLSASCAVSGALILAVTGFSAFVFSVVRTETQGDALGGILVIMMSILGGAFVPLQAMPEFFQGMARFTLNHWANESLRALATGGGLEQILPSVIVLTIIGSILTLAGGAALGIRHMRGAL